jgi:hypothetical protein
MGKVVCKCGIKRKKGYLYFIDKRGNATETKMARGKKRGGGRKVVCKCGIKKKKGCLYYIDRRGNACEAKMVVGGKRKKKRRK